MPKFYTSIFILICLFVNVSGQAQSKWEGYHQAGCVGAGIAVWPYSDTIYPASYILLQCLGTDQEIIRSINANYHVYLKNAGDTLNLLVVDITDGKSNITSMLLKPAKPLQAGKEYTLHIDNDSIYKQVFPGESIRANDFGYELGTDHDIKWLGEKKWVVSSAQPDTIPTWHQKPVELHRYSGSIQGTAEMIKFDMNALGFGYKLQDAGGCVFKVRLTNTAEQTESILYVTPTDSTFVIGRANTCFGNYMLDKHTTYKAAFNVLDKFGREHKWKGREVSFTSPD
jgi:hypothetical protein